MAYQEAELLEAESWSLVNVVHQAARCGHHNVGQATETICSANHRDSEKGSTSRGHLTQSSHVPKDSSWAEEGPLQEATARHTYVF